MRYAAGRRTCRWSLFALASIVASLSVAEVSPAAVSEGASRAEPRSGSSSTPAMPARPTSESRADRDRSPRKLERRAIRRSRHLLAGKPLRPPTQLRVVEVTTSSISLTWRRPNGSGRSVPGFDLFRDSVWVGWTSNTTYLFTDLSCGTGYVLGVAASYSATERSPVATLAATTDPCVDTTPPTMPGNLRVTGTTASSVTIAWDASRDEVGVAGYGLYRGADRIDSTQATSYTFSGLPCGTSQSLGVDSYDAARNQSPIATITASTEACGDTTPPTTPGNLHVTATTASSITIAWDASKDDVGVVGYDVYNGVNRIDGTQATSYTVVGLPCGVPQLLGVAARDAARNQSPLAVLTASAAACTNTEPLPIAGQGYRKVFADEFTTLDRSVWDDHIWYDEAPLPSWAPTQYIDNGILNLVSRRNDRYSGCTSNCYPIITVTTLSSGKSFQYGYFEARMRWTKGPGSWPAFWLLSTAWARTGSCATPAGELDVMEGQGTEPTVLYGTIHRDSANRCGGDAINGNN